MSTLKVNAIEPYSGGTVTITGASIENATSASYAETANTLTAGNKTINGTLDVNTGGVNVNGGPVILNNQNIALQRTDGGTALSLLNGNFFSQFVGAATSWNSATGTANRYLASNTGGELKQIMNTFDGATFDNNFSIIEDSQGTKFADVDAGFTDQIWLQVDQEQTPTFKRGLQVDGGQVTLNSQVNVNQPLFANNNINANLGIRVSGSNIVQVSGFPGQQAHIFQNENFFTSFYGTDLRWSETGGTSGLVMGELNEVVLAMNSFTPDFSTDNLFEVKSTLANGTTIGDWSGTWMQVPEAGTPVMKRGLTIEGLGDYADDAAAATGGVPVNGVYRTGSALKIRVV